MLKYMKIPNDVKNKQEEILKIFGCHEFSARCVNKIEGARSLFVTEYFFNDDPSNKQFVWGCTEGELQDMMQGEDNVIELFIDYKLKYLNKLGSHRSS